MRNLLANFYNDVVPENPVNIIVCFYIGWLFI